MVLERIVMVALLLAILGLVAWPIVQGCGNDHRP